MLIGIFRNRSHVSKWIVSQKYRGTGNWTTQFPVNKNFAETMYRNEDSRNREQGMAKMPLPKVDVSDTISPEDVFNSIPAPDYIEIVDMSYKNWYVDFKDDAVWQKFQKEYTLTREAKDKGWCCACQHNYGMMVVLDSKNAEKGGTSHPCFHSLLIPRIVKNKSRQSNRSDWDD